MQVHYSLLDGLVVHIKGRVPVLKDLIREIFVLFNLRCTKFIDLLKEEIRKNRMSKPCAKSGKS